MIITSSENRFALEQRVKQYIRSQIPRVSDDDLWEEARRRETESWRELQAVSSFQAVEEQRSHTRVVRGMRYSPTGTPRRRARLELSGEYIPIDRDQTEPSVSVINVGALRAPTTGDDRYCMLDSGANGMVIPKMEGMVGDETMCSLVGDNRATGLIVSRLYIGRNHIGGSPKRCGSVAARILGPHCRISIIMGQSIRGRDISPERWLWRIGHSP